MFNTDTEFFNDIIRLNPLLGTFYGFYVHEHDYINPNTLEYREMLRGIIDKYSGPGVNGRKPSKYEDVLQYTLKLESDMLKYPFHLLAVNHFNNPFKDILDILERMQFNSEGVTGQQDPLRAFESFKTRIHKMISICPELKQNLLDGVSKGIVENKKVIEILIRNLGDIDIRADVVHKYIRPRYVAFMNNVFVPEAKKFAKFLKDEYLGHCKHSLGYYGFPCDRGLAFKDTLGLKMYKVCLKRHLNVDIPWTRVYKLGIKLVKQLDTDIQRARAAIHERAPSGFKTAPEVITVYKQALKQIEKDSRDIVEYPKGYKTCNVVPMSDEFQPAALFFSSGLVGPRNGAGPPCGPSRGIFKVNVREYRKLMHHDVRNLVIHEAVPGHSLQLQYSSLNTRVPNWLRISNYTSVCEGWALYTERFIKDPSPLETLSTLNSMQLRAVRLVVDVGIHVLGFTFDDCYSFMSRYLYNTRSEIVSEIYRYSVVPGQSCSYMIGCLEIEKMFKESGLTAKQFNTRFLKQSFLPLWRIRV